MNNNPHNRPYVVRFTCTPMTNYDYSNGMSIANTIFNVNDAKTGRTVDCGPSFKIAMGMCEMLNGLDKEIDDIKKLLGLFDIDTQQYPNW